MSTGPWSESDLTPAERRALRADEAAYARRGMSAPAPVRSHSHVGMLSYHPVSRLAHRLERIERQRRRMERARRIRLYALCAAVIVAAVLALALIGPHPAVG